ncbi:MAG TPA: glycosyltransferase [Longimicrobium sp.]|jgi:glycosyltransferase involved in cell wall biosynthesis
MRLSVIVSTYNKPHFLERVLWGYAVQTDRDFELVVADDGSGPETAELIRRVRAESKMDIVHVWHDDRGFRKTEILNRAIVASRGDYLLFTDGDCIPRRDVVEVHRALARPGRYLAGGYLKLPADVSERIGVEDVTSGRVSELRWLWAQGWRPGRRALRLVRSPKLAALFDRITPTAAHFHGNNASTWRDAILRVNGFEGKMGYGGLDRALGYRLENAGVRGVQIRHRAVALHLHHDRPYRRPEVVSANRAILDAITRERLVRAEQGIAELAPDPTLRVLR